MSRMRAIAMLAGSLVATLVTPGCNDIVPSRPALTDTAVSPGAGPLAGGASVTITGTNFLNVSSVTIGGNALGSRTVLSAPEITGTTPTATSPGAKDVVVTSSSHGSGTCRGCFTYGSGSGAGGQIAFMSLRDGNWEIYLMNADGSGFWNLTGNPADDGSPAWSPDGSRIAFATNRDGNWEIYVVNADGSGAVNLTNDPGSDEHTAWSPDGAKIAFEANRDGNREIYVMNADDSGAPNLTNNPAHD